jgi:hypothetical protein
MKTTRSARRLRRTIALGLAAAGSANAQFVKGTVRDATSKDPLEGAFAALMDTTGAMVYGARTDRRGHYVIQVRYPGIYAIVATYPGHLREVSGWLTLTAADSVGVVSSLAPFRTQLSPVVIRGQRDSLRALRVFGLSLNMFGGTIITPAQVTEAAKRSVTVYDLVESLHVPGLMLRYMRGGENCITYVRTNGCVLPVIDGVLYERDATELNKLLGPESISYMMYMRPTEATTYYGTLAHNGVLFIVTKGKAK